MHAVFGDIWSHYLMGWIVVPSSQGVSALSGGATVASPYDLRVAAQKVKDLSTMYGEWLRSEYMNELFVIEDAELIIAPIIPQNQEDPGVSWRDPPSIELMQYTCSNIRAFADSTGADRIMMPLLGATLWSIDGLDPITAAQVMYPYFGDDRFQVYIPSQEVIEALVLEGLVHE